MNELAIQPDEFISNLGFILNQMPNYGVLIVADLSEYPSVMNLFKRIEGYVKKVPSFQIVRSYTEGASSFRTSLALPEIIISNLLTGEEDLKPRVNVKYNYLIAQKVARC
ncbi:MAG: hypothetical protein HC866_05785 [Leptolyngbyaceae cyanobacterium RU_5_1]|nr:hypothetical protein [Leptolyngbyaceae cyanobacterium RU_5_1]